ncbi:MAG: ornithine carbamoyltransferase [Candidatus Latescibacterota bacterium]|nr:MAG: ornithine carbamoyltransferase [Candidatus Latescibacterota bacterium]
MPLKQKDFVSIADYTAAEVGEIIDLAIAQKAELMSGRLEPTLKGKTLGCIFHKPSLRTRVSFEVAMHQLGGDSLYLTDQEIGIGSREAPQDVARVLSRYVSAIMIRTFDHSVVETLARFATIPVINGLTDLLHPCQVLADLMTIQEHRGNLDNLTVAFIGDGNNVARSWINAAAKLSLRVVLGCPPGFGVEKEFVDRALDGSSGRYTEVNDPVEAVKEADVLYTDVWASMGQESEAEKRKKAFAPFQLNSSLVAKAPDHAVVLHCLPAHRGEEITDDVIESQRSLVFDEAENRLHVQRALLSSLVPSGGGN